MYQQIFSTVLCRVGTWFYSSVVVRMDAALNASLQVIVRKGQGLSRLNDLRSPEYITRKKSVVPLKDRVIF